MRIRRLSARLVTLLAAATIPATVHGETVNCTHITTVPAVTTRPVCIASPRL